MTDEIAESSGNYGHAGNEWGFKDDSERIDGKSIMGEEITSGQKRLMTQVNLMKILGRGMRLD